jgi:hypothetical protein
MSQRVMRCAAALLAVAAMVPTFAELPPQACEVQPSPVHPLLDRDGTLSRYEQLPQHCLEALFMRCAAEANQQILDFGSAAACSIGYEALLKRGFAGDFQALMAWWRTQRPGESAAN